MKKLQSVSLAVLWLSLILQAAGRLFFSWPDWTTRLNGVIMLVAMALLVFSSVRLHINHRKD